MDRRPHLIAPVIIVACALIVVGGIGTALSGTGDTAATVRSPVVLMENETAVPTAGTMPEATGAGSAFTTRTATTCTGAGAGANGAASGVNATATSPTATAENGTAGAVLGTAGTMASGAGTAIASVTGNSTAISLIVGTFAPTVPPADGTP